MARKLKAQSQAPTLLLKNAAAALGVSPRQFRHLLHQLSAAGSLTPDLALAITPRLWLVSPTLVERLKDRRSVGRPKKVPT